MTTGIRPPRRLLLKSLLICTALVASEGVMAGLLDLLFGKDPPLVQRLRMGPEGLALRESFEIKEKCGYEFSLRFLHPQEKFGELDAVFPGKTFPVPVMLSVFRESGDAAAVLKQERAPTVNGRGKVGTTFTLARVSLDEGRYRVELRAAAVPQLENVDAEFLVHLRPKTSCP
jgi:hypothetical protein